MHLWCAKNKNRQQEGGRKFLQSTESPHLPSRLLQSLEFLLQAVQGGLANSAPIVGWSFSSFSWIIMVMMITWWLLWSTWEFGYNSTMGYQMSRWYAHFHNESIHQFGSIYMVFGCLWFPRTSFNISVYVAFKIQYIYILCILYIY